MDSKDVFVYTVDGKPLTAEEFAKRKYDFQLLEVEILGCYGLGARYIEQSNVLDELSKPEYKYAVRLEVRLGDTWKNKYHNFLSQVARSPLYEMMLNSSVEELESLL